jgi:hypothetical protein
MSEKQKRTVTLNLRVTPEIKAMLAEWSKNSGDSQADVVTTAIRLLTQRVVSPSMPAARRQSVAGHGAEPKTASKAHDCSAPTPTEPARELPVIPAGWSWERGAGCLRSAGATLEEILAQLGPQPEPHLIKALDTLLPAGHPGETAAAKQARLLAAGRAQATVVNGKVTEYREESGYQTPDPTILPDVPAPGHESDLPYMVPPEGFDRKDVSVQKVWVRTHWPELMKPDMTPEEMDTAIEERKAECRLKLGRKRL